jgi:pyridoxal phosphate enzyme (YggS family)
LSDLSTTIAANIARVRKQIATAARRSGRTPSDVRLVAVTKYVDADVTRALVDAGCCDLGESRPQDLWAKAESLADANVAWHLIGHLQRNKIRRTLPLVKLIHSIDRQESLAAIDRIAGELQIAAHVLIEVNTSGDASKDGISPADVLPLLESAASYPHVAIDGLMTMAAFAGGSDVAKRNFAALRMLRDELKPQCPDNVSLAELSMGMSGDFEEAIEEGATIVRIGSALFEGVTPS